MDNKVVLEGITDDIYSQHVSYDKELWTLGSLLYSYFPDEEPKFIINTVEFTIDELSQYLLQRAKDKVNKLQSEGYIVHGGPNNE